VARGPRRRYPSPTGLPGGYILADDAQAAALGLTGGTPAPIYEPAGAVTFLDRTATLAALAEAAGGHPVAVAAWRLGVEARLDVDELVRLEALTGAALAAATVPEPAPRPASNPVEKPEHTGPPPDDAPADKRRPPPPNTGRRRPRDPGHG